MENNNNNMYGQNGGVYQPKPDNGYTPVQPYGQTELEEPVSMGEWMISMLLMCIPCVNIILMFVWAFGGNAKKSKANFYRASLIWTAIAVVVYIIVVVAVVKGVASAF